MRSADADRRCLRPWLGGGEGPEPVYPRSLAVSAAERYGAGDADGAASDARRLSAELPKSPAGPVILALLEAQAGRKGASLASFERALKRSNAAWVYAARGSLRARWGELAAAAEDLRRACRGNPEPWTLIERADVLRKRGQWAAALRELRREHRRFRGSFEALRRIASLCLDQAQFDHAVVCLSDALRLQPGDAALLRDRARLRFVSGDLGGALRDLDAARRSVPKDPGLALERLRVLCAMNDLAAAERIVREALPPAEAAFARGVLAFRRGDHAGAAKAFDASGGTTAKFYAAAAKGLQALDTTRPGMSPRRGRRSGPELVLLGLGMRQPYQVSLETLEALKGCRVVFNYIPDAAVLELLSLFDVERKSVLVKDGEDPADVCARLFKRELKKGGRIGFMTRGNALMYGRVPRRLLTEARLAGVPSSVTGSVSMFEHVGPLGGDPPAARPGLQVRSFHSIERGHDPALPLVVYFPAEREDPAKVARVLKGSYPAAHACRLFTGAGGNELERMDSPLSELGGRLRVADPGATLLLPPRPASPRARAAARSASR